MGSLRAADDDGTLLDAQALKLPGDLAAKFRQGKLRLAGFVPEIGAHAGGEAGESGEKARDDDAEETKRDAAETKSRIGRIIAAMTAPPNSGASAVEIWSDRYCSSIPSISQPFTSPLLQKACRLRPPFSSMGSLLTKRPRVGPQYLRP